MERYRIGNDISITWSITKNGSPAELAGRAVKLFLSHPRGREEVTGFSVEGNVVSFVFDGLSQSVLGKYTLTIDVRDADGSRYLIKDKCNAFALVSRSCMECGDDDYTLEL